MTERILASICVLALILKLLHIPGSGILWAISVVSLSTMYFYFGRTMFGKLPFKAIFNRELFPNFSNIQDFVYKGAGMVLSAGLIGILFKFQHWPGARIMLIVGAVGCFTFAIYFILKKNLEERSANRKMIIRGLAIGTVCLFLYAVPHSIWLNWQYPDHPDYVKAELEYIADPGNEELMEKRNEELDKMYDE